MPKRRARGEGTLYQRKDGLWTAQITLPDGKRKTKYAKTQKAARDWLNDQQTAIRQGAWSSDPDVTVETFFRRYYEDVAAHSISPQTLRTQKRVLNKHVLPNLGKLKLSKLRPDHIQRLYSSMAEAGYAPSYINVAHNIIRKTLAHAVRWGLLVRSPSTLVTLPKLANTPPPLLSDEQLHVFLDGTEGHWLRPLTLVAVTTGLRRGEILGLRWEDVDLENAVLNVAHGVIDDGKGPRLADPKTARSRRRITLPMIAVDALRHHRDNPPTRWTGWQDHGLVFPSHRGGLMHPNKLSVAWHRKLKALGLPPVTFHSLRHLHSTKLLLAGISPKVVQERLGHASVSITLDIYSHVTTSLERQAAEAIDRSFTA